MSTIERVWHWRFAPAPEALWPLLANTARFNEAMGLPRYRVSEQSAADGTVSRTGTARRWGMTITWDEGVPEWVAPRFFRHERRFRNGPLRRVVAEIAIDPISDTGSSSGSDVRYRLCLEPRIAALAPLLQAVLHWSVGRDVERLFRTAAETALIEEGAAFPMPSPALSAAVRERIASRARAVSAQGYGAAGRLAAHLIEASDSDVERMRPRVLARRWQVPPRDAIETCLAAAREGLLILRWDLICPRCRGAKAVARSLDELPRGAHCPSCNIPFDRDFSRNVEVTFDPGDDIRPLPGGTFCLANPIAAGHIQVQRRFAAGEEATIAATLANGDYRIRTVEPLGVEDIRIADRELPDIVLNDDKPAISGGGGDDRLHVRNATGRALTLVIEDRAWASDALTAHEVTTMQAFRDLFGDAVLRPGDEVEIRRVTLLFTDIRGSSDLYNRLGDAQAYGWVREHFAVLARAVRAHDGAIVKTIGDAVMAAFSNPLDALAAAVAMRDDISSFNKTLAPADERGNAAIVVKLGVHCGPCIAVTLNDRLDYFGRTVNLAARLEAESRGGDIVVSAAMAQEPGLMAALAALAPTAETARVKGFAEPIALYRVPPADPTSAAP